MNEFKPNEEFQFGFIKLKCKETHYGRWFNKCTNCIFNLEINDVHLCSFGDIKSVIGNCSKENRTDNKDIIFIKI